MGRGKRYEEAYAKIDRTKAYEPAEAVRLVKAGARANFDETVELHIRLGVNVRHAEERGADVGQRIRPKDRVTDMVWEPSSDWSRTALDVAKGLKPPTVECSGCHR